MTDSHALVPPAGKGADFHRPGFFCEAVSERSSTSGAFKKMFEPAFVWPLMI